MKEYKLINYKKREQWTTKAQQNSNSKTDSHSSPASQATDPSTNSATTPPATH